MITYLSRHLQVLFATLGDMRRTPMASLNTLLIIAITLLLPSLLYVGVKSAQSLSSNWEGRPQISIFLQKELSNNTAQLIFEEIQLHPSIELAEFITPEQALAEFRVLSGDDVSFEQELAFLGSNPLPASIVIMPDRGSAKAENLLALKDQLTKFDGIDTVRLDLNWTDRFNAILLVFSRISLLLSALLALALLLIVGNTIKLLIFNRRDEIEITKLVGGTDTFVRRPFLYYGALFGFFGALISLSLLLIAARLTQQPISELAALYSSDALVHQVTVSEIFALISIGTLLGWLAARWSVAQHLRNIQPK
ncbi:MAG: cell division transport system permease protein [Arenicella sp.]|jgi:cell division transport system permease protein